MDKIHGLVQSDEVIKLSSFKITFNFTVLPAGSGRGLESRTLLEHYQKRSVVRVINNDDHTCFWYCMVNLMYPNQPKKSGIRTGRNIQYDLAKRLCGECQLPFDKPVKIEFIPAIEKSLQCNITSLMLKHVQHKV